MSNSTSSLYVSALGLATAFGSTRAETYAAVSEDANPFTQLETYYNAGFAPQLAGFEYLGDFRNRLTTLAIAALNDAIDQLAASEARPAETSQAQLLLALPAGDPGTGGSLDNVAETLSQTLVAHASDRGIRLLPALSAVMIGTPAVGVTLQRAIATMQTEGPTGALLVAVDSYADRGRLRALDRAGNLFGDHNPWGLVPGEAAGAMFLRGGPEHAIGRIAGAAVTNEPHPEGSLRNTDYRAFSDVVHAALVGSDAPSFWFSDWNNSRYRASQLSYAALRTPEFKGQTEHPAMTFGDCGAAFGLLSVALGLQGAEGGSSLVTASAPSGHCSAFTFEPIATPLP